MPTKQLMFDNMMRADAKRAKRRAYVAVATTPINVIDKQRARRV